MVLVWDLTKDEQFEAPTLTVRAPWTKGASVEERANAGEELRDRLGERVLVLRNLS